jgi:hypothetical protein
MKFTVAVDGGGAQAEFEVHRTGCQDVARGVRSRKYSHSYDAGEYASAADLVADEVAAFAYQEQDWTAEDFRVMACASQKG